MQIVTLRPDGKKTIAELVHDSGISWSLPCGGNGLCGGCKIRVISGAPDPIDQERAIISEEELLSGYRLACRCRPSLDFTIELPDEDKVDVLSVEKDRNSAENRLMDSYETRGGIKLAIDIGTTTIAVASVDASSGRILATTGCLNHQRQYGTDVLSRIQYGMENSVLSLQESVARDVDSCIRKLSQELRLDLTDTYRIISCNTSMRYFYMGYDVKELGIAPFLAEQNSYECYGRDVILPGISAFVGGDIVSGMYALNLDRMDGLVLFLDLGTNGELVLGGREGFLSTSTSCGPAFEAGSISAGVASIPGAIYSTKLISGFMKCSTIEGERALGICGSGVISIVSELLRNELIDHTGKLVDPYFEEGFPVCRLSSGETITFTQDDIRQVQMAKAAIRAGIEKLLTLAEVSYEDISHVYLAGGFGSGLDLDAVYRIGLLPDKLLGCTEVVGNTSLQGAIRFAIRPDRDRIEKIASMSTSIELANEDDFEEMYIKYMNF